MGEDTHALEQEIRARRTDLGRNLDELEDRARKLADWRTHYRQHPAAFLGAALGAGVVLALATVSRSREAVDERPAAPDTSHDVYHLNGAFARDPDPIDRIQRQFGETWDQIANGLLQLAAAKAIDVVSDLVPGFSDHVDEQPRPRSRTLH